MKKLTDKEISTLLINIYPPTNKNLLKNWVKQTNSEIIKEYIYQWIDIIDSNRILIDSYIYESVVKIAKS